MIPSLLTDTVTVSLDRAVHYALLWGLEGVELRNVGGVHDRVPFVNESKIKSRLMESDLPVIAVDPGLFAGDVSDRAGCLNDLALFDESIAFCGRMGCRRVVVSSFRGEGDTAAARAAETLARAAEKATRAGVTVCVLNEAGGLAPTGELLGALIEAAGEPALAAAWDPAEAMCAGEDPAEGLRALGDRIDLVRCRNGRLTGNGWQPQSIDNGKMDWLDQLRHLDRVGYNGPLSLVVEGEPKPKRGLDDATALIRSVRAVKRESEHQSR